MSVVRTVFIGRCSAFFRNGNPHFATIRYCTSAFASRAGGSSFDFATSPRFLRISRVCACQFHCRSSAGVPADADFRGTKGQRSSPDFLLHSPDASAHCRAQQECQQMPTSVAQRGSAALTTSNGSSSALTAAAQQEKQRERTAFLERYNPQVCRLMALDADRCFRGNAPSLVRVKRDYGVQTAVTWMTIQLSETARLWGSSDKISGEMLEAVAESFVGEYSHLNLAEIGLYLSRLRAGVYGKVAYGKLTPDHMVSHVQTFLAQRSREIDVFRREQERIDRQRERKRWASRAVSHEEAKRRYAEALALCNNDPDRAIEYMKRVRR